MMFRTRVRVKVIRLLSEPPARRRKVDIPNNPNTHGMFVQSGLSAVARVKKAGVNCMHCSMPIPKGDIRFEFVWKINKPPRSIHTTCLNQLDEQTCASSTRFLETLLSQNPPNDCEELQACRAALRTLQGMMEVYNVAWFHVQGSGSITKNDWLEIRAIQNSIHFPSPLLEKPFNIKQHHRYYFIVYIFTTYSIFI